VNFKTSKPEWALLGICLTLILVALLGPAVAQPANHHHFADQRGLWGIPCAWDVLSNLPFALMGFWGLSCLKRVSAISRVQRTCAALFFFGLVATAVCSSWYHWRPDDAGLAVDRLGMVVAFAGLIGLAVADRISARAGMVLAALVLVLGPLSVQVWAATGNVLHWAVLQFGGMALMLWLASVRPLDGALAVRLVGIILVYAVAKLFEQADPAVFAWTGQMVSGHTLKHVVASLAALPVIFSLRNAAKSGQNPAGDRTKVARQTLSVNA
jgi:hypothetical protein